MELLANAELFSAVIREGGISKAARALGVSKSFVSKQIAKLESDLGVRLLSRTTKQVQPTEAGELLYERCVQLIELAEDAQTAIATLVDEPVGRLKVSVPLSFGRAFLEAPLIEFAARYPRVDLSIDLSDRAVNLIGEGYDLAVRVGPVTDPDLVVRRLAETRRMVVAAPSYIEAHGQPSSPEEIRGHQCLLYAYQATSNRWLFDVNGRKLEVPVTGRFRSNNGDVLASAAARGLGLAWLPEFVARPHLASGSLVALLESNCRETSVVNAVLGARTHVPVKVRALLELIAEHLDGDATTTREEA